MYCHSEAKNGVPEKSALWGYNEESHVVCKSYIHCVRYIASQLYLQSKLYCRMAVEVCFARIK